jgi:hypothetical protein
MSAGKGDRPRNNFSREFRENYDIIQWRGKQKMRTSKRKAWWRKCPRCNGTGKYMVIDHYKAYQDDCGCCSNGKIYKGYGTKLEPLKYAKQLKALKYGKTKR